MFHWFRNAKQKAIKVTEGSTEIFRRSHRDRHKPVFQGHYNVKVNRDHSMSYSGQQFILKSYQVFQKYGQVSSPNSELRMTLIELLYKVILLHRFPWSTVLSQHARNSITTFIRFSSIMLKFSFKMIKNIGTYIITPMLLLGQI